MSMDFVTHLPCHKVKLVIMVVVDYLTMFCHLGALLVNYMAIGVGDLFINIVIKLHEYPTP